MFIFLPKVDYQTKAKNRSRGVEPFSTATTLSNNGNSTVINGGGNSSHGDFNGPIHHIAVVPPLMKSTVITSNHQQHERTSLPLQPSSAPHNMSLPLTSTSSSTACQFNLDGGKLILFQYCYCWIHVFFNNQVWIPDFLQFWVEWKYVLNCLLWLEETQSHTYESYLITLNSIYNNKKCDKWLYRHRGSHSLNTIWDTK